MEMVYVLEMRANPQLYQLALPIPEGLLRSRR